MYLIPWETIRALNILHNCYPLKILLFLTFHLGIAHLAHLRPTYAKLRVEAYSYLKKEKKDIERQDLAQS